MSKFQSYLNYIADPRARRSLRSIFTTFLNDDEDMTFRSFTFGASGASVSVAVLDFEDAFHGKIIETGTYSSAVDKGVALSDTNPRPVSFLFDDSANSLTEDVRAVLSRVYLSVDQDGGGTIFPIRSQLKLAAGVDFGVGGRYGCIDAYMELAGDTEIKSGVEASLLDVRLEIASTKTLTVAASGELIGIHVQLIGAGTLTTTGDSYGIKVEDNGTITGDWKYGVYLANVTTGLYVGACTTGISLAGAFTTGISIAADGTTAISVTSAFSGVNMISLDGTGSTSGIIISGACAIPLNITGAFTTGVTIAADGTTAISVTSAFTGVDMISLAGTGSTSGITISGACVIPLNITGAFTTGITIAADGTTAISVTSAFSGVTGIALAGTGSTAGINISGNHTTAITIGAQTTAGLAITGATATGISITGACSTAALQMGVSGTPAGDLVWYGTTALYLVRFDANGDTNGAVYIGTDTKGLMFNLYGDITGCGVFWDPSGDTNGSLTIGGSGGSKGVDVTMYGATNGCTLQWDQSVNALLLTTTSALTTGTIRSETIAQTMTVEATANVVEVLRASLTANVKTGAWANAIVGSIDYSTNGAAHGMAAAICAELIPPNSSLARGALYALDVVIGCGASSSWGSAGPVAFMHFENWGTKAYMSANGYFFHLAGETGATGGLLSLTSQTVKCLIGASTARYLLFSQYEDTLSIGLTGAKKSLLTGVPEIAVWSTSALTSGTQDVMKIDFTQTQAVTSGYIKGLRCTMTSDVCTPGSFNAIKGIIDYSTNGYAHGDCACLAAEMTLPNSTVPRGAYYGLEIQMSTGASTSWSGGGGPVAFMRLQMLGTPLHFEEHGYLFHLAGFGAATAGEIFDECTAAAASHALKILIGTTPYYIMLQSNVDA